MTTNESEHTPEPLSDQSAYIRTPRNVVNITDRPLQRSFGERLRSAMAYIDTDVSTLAKNVDVPEAVIKKGMECSHHSIDPYLIYPTDVFNIADFCCVNWQWLMDDALRMTQKIGFFDVTYLTHLSQTLQLVPDEKRLELSQLFSAFVLAPNNPVLLSTLTSALKDIDVSQEVIPRESRAGKTYSKPFLSSRQALERIRLEKAQQA